MQTATLTRDFVDSYKDKTPPWGFNGLGYIVYKRTYSRALLGEDGEPTGKTEEWWQTVKRVIDGAQAIGANLTDAEAHRLYDYMFNLKALPAGRVLWQLGTPNMDRIGMDGAVNCWFTEVASVKDFGWIFERLMLGGGVGFSIDRGEHLGPIRQGQVEHVGTADCDFIAPDNREGWAELVVRTISTYLEESPYSDTLRYSTQLIRPYGTPIKGFGGVASGPGVLIDGIKNITKVLDGAVGRHLEPIEILDIINIIGQVVVAGNVRRSALIALGSPFDREYLTAKRWACGECEACTSSEGVCSWATKMPIWRHMSNNSLYIDSDGFSTLRLDHEAFHQTETELKSAWETLWDAYKGYGEPYGFVNIDNAQKYGRIGEERYDPTIAGTNPCGEIMLGHHESCNLAEIFLPNIDSLEEMIDVAKLLYKVQKAIAALPALDPTSNAITKRNMRLGLGVGGVAQAMDKLAWLDPTYQALRDFDRVWSAANQWPESVRLTTVKPSGTLSLLAGITPGVHPGFSRFHIRRVRMAIDNPLVEYCRNHGYPVEPDITDPDRTMVVEFPAEFPEGTMLADDMSATKLLDLVRLMQSEWADNAVSVSVYYQKEEIPEIQDYLLQHWPTMKSVSFILQNGHGFAQAPLEEISEEEYRRRVVAIHGNGGVEADASWDLSSDECESGACPIR